MTRGAVVLAAGRSDRMGRPKALLPCHGKTFLRTILDTLHSAGVTEVRVVLGHAAAAIRQAEPLSAGIAVINEGYESGMLSSVRTGVQALPTSVDAFLLWPVDHPLASEATVDRLFVEAAASRRAIAVPAFRGKRGHPALFAARLAPELLSAPENEGARAVLRTRACDVLEIDVLDAGVVADIDTPEAYRAAFGVAIQA